MATGFSDIITAALVIIDDTRWRRDLDVNPAAFYRAKIDWIEEALAKLNRPPELGEYLESTMQAPAFADAEWTSTAESTSGQAAVHTGKTGFELCCVCAYDGTGTKQTPYTDFTYDPLTGDVIFGVQTAAGIRYTIDFYTDGSFGPQNGNLTVRQKELFAYAVAIVWDTRMDRNWLNLQAKVHDSSFNTPSEGPYAREINQRLMRNTQLFNDKCSKYEQDCAYRTRFRRGGPQTTVLV